MSDYKWIREDKEEFFTGDYDAEGNPIYDVPEDVEFSLYTEIETIEDLENPIEAQNISNYLHSQMKTPFYLYLCEAQRAEIQYLLDAAMQLSNIYNVDLFLGSETEFKSRVTNVTTLLGFELPLFLSDKITAAKGTNLLVDRIKWYRELLTTMYLLRRWSGSSLGYKSIFNLIKKRGSLFLRAQYKQTDFTSETDKFYRLLSAEDFSNNTIESPTYPLSYGISGEEDYATAKLKLIQFDTKLVFDKSGVDSPPVRFDAPASSAGATTKGLDLEISLDEILRHTNSLQTEKCLMDNDWLKAISTFLKVVKKASDKVSIGTQLSLTALSNGRYSKYPEGITEEDLKKYLYTHPNIEAKFQVFPNLYNGASTDLAYVKVGSGSLDPLVFNPSDSDNYEILLKEYPKDIANPLFQTSIGFNEQGLLGRYKLIMSSIHNQKFSDQPVTFEGVYINKELTPVRQTSVLKFPHPSLAYGSVYFTLKFPSPDNDEYNDRYLYITQTYNELKNVYDPKVVIKKPLLIYKAYDLVAYAENLLLSGMAWEDVLSSCKEKFFLSQAQLDKLSRTGEFEVTYGDQEGDLEEVVYISFKEINDKAYSIFVKDTDFFRFEDVVENSFLQGDVDSFIKLEPLQGELDSYGNAVAAKIDNVNGEISLRISYNTENYLGYQAGGNQSDIDEVTLSGKVSYEINSKRSYASRQQFDEQSNRASITEMGVFDSDDNLVAYATFPPIIYDASKYHLSLNLALDTTPLIEDPVPSYLEFLKWSFSGVPEIPDNVAGTKYIQDLWATTDSWDVGTGAASLMVLNGVLLVQGTGSYNSHQIFRNIDYVSGEKAKIKLEYNEFITSVKIYDGVSLKTMKTYRSGDYLFADHIFENSDSTLTIQVGYTNTTKAFSEQTAVEWIYVGDETYTSKVEDETTENNDGIMTKTSLVEGIKGKALAFLDPEGYVTIE